MWGDNQTVAYAMQDYFTSFAVKGVPDSSIDGFSMFPTYGDNATVVQLSTDGIKKTRDPAANQRCAWWQLVLLD